MTSTDPSILPKSKASLLHYFKKMESPAGKAVSSAIDLSDGPFVDEDELKKNEVIKDDIHEPTAAKVLVNNGEDDLKKSKDVPLKSSNKGLEVHVESENGCENIEETNSAVSSETERCETELNTSSDSQKENDGKQSPVNEIFNNNQNKERESQPNDDDMCETDLHAPSDSQKENVGRQSPVDEVVKDNQNKYRESQSISNERTPSDTSTGDMTNTPVRRSARIKRLSVAKANSLIETPVVKVDNKEPLSSVKKRKSLAQKLKKNIKESDEIVEKCPTKKKIKEGGELEDAGSSTLSKLKVAPLFLLSKKKKKKNIDDESDDDIQIVETSVDKTPVVFISEERKAFLHSGVPEILKQKQVSSIEIELTYPPLSGGIHVRNLSTEETLHDSLSNGLKKLRIKSPTQSLEIKSLDPKFEFMCKNVMESSYQAKVKVVTNDNLERYIEEIKRILPKFPVKKYYDLLISRREEHGRLVQSTDGNVDSSNCGYDHIPWTEKYGSSTGRGILGGNKDILKLKKWLEEWKKKTTREENKTSKRMQEDKHKNRKDKKIDDDSDDDFVSRSDTHSDFSEDDDNLPSAYLIVGPHGCGKTALVYGLAEQLNYKVFEVNASSKRSGKQISQQLEEAMRSQHVAKDQLSSMFSTFEMTRAAKCPEVKKSPVSNKKRKADALLNFFQPKTKRLKVEDESAAKKGKDGRNSRGKDKQECQQFTQLKPQESCDAAESTRPRRRLSLRRGESDVSTAASKSKESSQAEGDAAVCGKRGRRRQYVRRKSEALEDTSMVDLDANSMGKAKGLTLASCSLILFDEVDVVFEEDKGFWSAIQMFLDVNKRPIILTCVDPRVVEQLDPDVEVCYLKKPSVASMAGYLSVVCLVEDFFVPVSDLKSLTKAFDFDVRRCLLWLQWQAAFSCSRIRIPQPLNPSTAGDTEGCTRVLVGPLMRLPGRRRAKPAEEDELDGKETHECSLLEVFSDDAPVRTKTVTPATSETSYSTVLATDWPRIDKWSSRSLNSALSFLGSIEVADHLRPKTKPAVADSCEDSPRWELEAASTLSAEISDAIEAAASASLKSSLKELREEISGNSDILGRLPERLEKAEVETLSAKDFYRLRRTVVKAVSPCVCLSERAVCTDYIPYVARISKTEDFKRLNQSKRRFLHYFDRISLDIDEDIRKLLYKDFS